MKSKTSLVTALLILLLLIFIVLIPWSINEFMKSGNISTGEGLASRDWLSFWGGYIGSAFGVIATIFAFLFTYIQNEKQHRITQNQLDEQIRLQVLPFLTFSFEAVDIINLSTDNKIPYIDFTQQTDTKPLHGGPVFANASFWKVKNQLNNCQDSSPAFIKVVIKNVGLSTAIDSYIKCSVFSMSAPIGSILKEDEKEFYWLFPLENKEYRIFFHFDDIQGRHYIQEALYSFVESGKEFNSVNLRLPSPPKLLP